MSRKEIKKVFVAMSGGVDSSVAALLLRDAGYDVTGVFMRCWSGSPSSSLGIDSSSKLGASCSWERDAADARRVAAHLGIPFYVFDFEEEYKKRVVEYMVEGYRKGITPNPDVMCNREIKFGLFLEKALALGADFIATGHYVRRQAATLYIARDGNKDQSYFLWTLTQGQLKRCLFPIGDYLKSEVREIARRAGLPTAEKKDSQGICFLGKVTLADFLKNYIAGEKGEVLTTDGVKVGSHEGAEFYTIGQRHVGVGGLTKPHYVAEKDVKANTVIVAEGADNPALYRKAIGLTSLNFISPDFREGKVLARVRYRQPLSSAKLTGNKLVFDSPQKFVAPGQSAVFYSVEGGLLGGGVIME